MASRTKPLISAAALASAAAIAVATPALSPSLGVPSPAALSKAAYELTTFADVLSVPPEVWTDLLFGNTDWGGTLSEETFGPDWAAPQDALGQPSYVNPWATYCNGNCTQSGIPGVSYLFWDALVNGNGNGFDDVDNWPIGLVNYFAEPNGVRISGPGSSPTYQFENYGYSAASWYVLQGTLGQAIPELQVPIAALFWGPTNATVGYNLALTTVAGLLQAVPIAGPLAGNTILAYLGDLPIDPDNPSLGFYQYGLSGALNFWVDIATGASPYSPFTPVDPDPAPKEAAALVAAPAAAEGETAVAASTVTESEATASGDAKLAGPTAAAVPASAVPVDAPAVQADQVEVNQGAPAELTPEAPAAEVGKVPAADIKEITPAEDTKPAVAPEPPALTEPVADSTDVDLKDLADLDEADDAPAETPKGVVSGGVKDETDQADSSAGEAGDSDAGASGAGASDAGASDAGDSDAGASDAGAGDAGDSE